MIDPNQTLILNVRGGARICVPADIEQITSYILLEQEDWFEDEIRFVRRWLRPGMRAVDVGASYGMYTLAMAQAVGGGGQVWAFEPTPRSADRLQRSLELNACSQTVMSRAAVSARAGTVAFAADAQSELNAVGGVSEDILQVQAVTLDQMAATHGWNAVDFVKLDVEGHEVEALRGGAGFFESASPLVMLEVSLGDRLDLSTLDPLRAMGYEPYRLLPGPLMLTPFDPLEPMDGSLLNLFACKRDRARRLAESGHLATMGAPGTAKATKGAWAAFVGSAAYACNLASGWRSRAGFFSSADHGTYFEGLDAFAHSRAASLVPAERLAWLDRALQCVADAIGANDTLARRLSYARIAAELGWRGAAVDCLRFAIEGMAGDRKAEVLQEPFIAPSERYERMAMGPDPIKWLTCAVVEQYEKLRHRSSLYTNNTSLEVLEPIADLPYRSAEVDRRRQLVRRRRGLPPIPASPLLLAASEENLNPQYWHAPR